MPIVIAPGSSSPTPAPAPTDTTPVDTTTISDLYNPSSASDEASIESAENDKVNAEENTAPNSTDIADATSQFQSEIDSTNAAYADAKAQLNNENNANQNQDRALQAKRGILNSISGAAETGNVQNAGNAKVQASTDQQTKDLAAIQTQVNTAAKADAALRTSSAANGADAKIAEITGRETRKGTAVSSIVQGLIASGIDPTTLTPADFAGITSASGALGITQADINAAYPAAKAAADKASQATLAPGSEIIDTRTGQPIVKNAPLDKYSAVKETDALGNVSYATYDTTTGKFVNSGGGASSGSGLPADQNGKGAPSDVPTGALNSGGNISKANYAKYGALANTDFNPSNTGDQLAQNYLNLYISSGKVPTASELGRTGLSTQEIANIQSRASDLYQQATGHALPNTTDILGNQTAIKNNIKLGNNLQLQTDTVSGNVDLSLANMTKNGINGSSFAPLNTLIDNLKASFNDPNVDQYLSQNVTLQNELGSLLAVKNAVGTTVYDKLSSAGLIPKGATPAVIQQNIQTLIKEAGNFSNALSNADTTAYGAVDPLGTDPNNPASATAFQTAALTKAGYKAPADVIAVAQKQGGIAVIDNNTGQVGVIPRAEMDDTKYTLVTAQ